MALRQRRVDTDGWTAFGLGVLGGVIGGLSLLSFAGIPAVALIAIAGGFGLRPQPFGGAGILVGWGATWLLVLAGAQARCDSASCVMPDLAPWIVVALGIAATGTGLGVVAIRRPAWSSHLARAAATVGHQRRVRAGIAVLLGVVSGLYASSLLIVGWATAMLIWGWFAWRHRRSDRRVEILWLTAAGIASLVVLLPR